MLKTLLTLKNTAVHVVINIYLLLLKERPDDVGYGGEVLGLGELDHLAEELI